MTMNEDWDIPTHNIFNIGDVVKQQLFLDMPERGVVKRRGGAGYVYVKLDGVREHYCFLDHELTLVPTHKEFTDEEYEALLV